MGRILDALRRAATGDAGPPPDLDATLAELRAAAPAPVFWLLGKTQSGKSSVVRFLTGADAATVGTGFRPCTRASRRFEFPSAEAPLLTFLDTRGLDEPGYDPAEDLAAFDAQAHLIVVTAKAGDFAQGNVRAALRPIRAANPARPVVLVLTCLHEVLPRAAWPLLVGAARPAHEELARCVAEHERAFAGLVDRAVCVDLTKPEDGFADPHFGGADLKGALLDALPAAQRQTLLRLGAATAALKDAHLRHALPLVTGYGLMAATAGAVPVPFVDLAVLPALQARMARDLARVYGQPMTAERYKELAAAVGAGVVTGALARQALKLVPFVGSAVGGAVAGASTYALGRALCYYFSAVCEGHVPSAEALRAHYQTEFAAARREWGRT